MSRYYSGSKPFEWLRKTLKINKPVALGWGEWDKWDAALKRQRPVAYFLTETLPDWLELPARWIVDPIHSAKYYLVNRFVDKRHMLKTKLPPGKWHEFDTRILHGMFEEFIDFVEIESAWHHLLWSDKETRSKYNMPWYYNIYLLRWRTWRCPEAGLAHYLWASELRWTEDEVGPDSEVLGQLTLQAVAAQEVLALYHWWKDVRPHRGDAWDATGFRDHWNQMNEKYGEDDWLLSNDKPTSAEEQNRYRELSDATHALEQKWDDEDQEMMIRLIKLRKNLWT